MFPLHHIALRISLKLFGRELFSKNSKFQLTRLYIFNWPRYT